MAEHANIALIRRGYDAFAKGDLEAIREIFSPDIAWHTGGRGPLSGDVMGVDAVFGFFGQLQELSGGTFRLEPHDVLADDDHVVVLANATGSRNGKSLDGHVVHVWHVSNAHATEFWGFAGDDYTFDEFWR
jgi:ketosteroid isomerase-like protein